MENHKHNYKSRWDEGTMGLAEIVQEPVAKTLEGVWTQLAHVVKHGTSLQIAKAFVMTVLAGWGYCEMHEHEMDE